MAPLKSNASPGSPRADVYQGTCRFFFAPNSPAGGWVLADRAAVSATAAGAGSATQPTAALAAASRRSSHDPRGRVEVVEGSFHKVRAELVTGILAHPMCHYGV